MKILSVLALGMWLAVRTIPLASAQPTIPQGPPAHPCDQPAGAAESGEVDGHAVVATIEGVDPQQGTLELATKDGRFSMAMSAAAMQGLRAGDQLLICLEGDDIAREERLADTPR